ncbi:uncharacterized protein B0I36DRAFT_360033 [Microdochium trichocladiopsis]|uniref:Rhodopsin domain-containing protein n=1 Tax=Microdochium trichocladiopsis TaxID=1682393 RepID=A0A9P8YCI1_9PEZI|nr:uncharacterized protein B0I36DRAFT_360033 [Microdochium trichocladiopsis]KAH7034518.1 hypothetical protein B0I36DRAFT_360033 [Microdochium trichocladiopsis]
MAIVILRLAVRTWTKMWLFALSDIFLVLALLFFLALVVGDTYSFSLGLLAFYNKLFPPSEHKMRVFLYLVTAYTTCGFISVILMDLMWCNLDIAANWSPNPDICAFVSSQTPGFISWPVGIVSEVLVFALPFGLLRRLRTLDHKEKIGLICIFMFGSATLLVSTTRFILQVQGQFSYGSSAESKRITFGLTKSMLLRRPGRRRRPSDANHRRGSAKASASPEATPGWIDQEAVGLGIRLRWLRRKVLEKRDEVDHPPKYRVEHARFPPGT